MEITYNPFKMWGSWVGFSIGALSALLWLVKLPSWLWWLKMMAIESLNLNPLIYFVNPWGSYSTIFVLIALLPLVFFIYGWGIHFLFRKFSK